MAAVNMTHFISLQLETNNNNNKNCKERKRSPRASLLAAVNNQQVHDSSPSPGGGVGGGRAEGRWGAKIEQKARQAKLPYLRHFSS